MELFRNLNASFMLLLALDDNNGMILTSFFTGLKLKKNHPRGGVDKHDNFFWVIANSVAKICQRAPSINNSRNF